MLVRTLIVCLLFSLSVNGQTRKTRVLIEFKAPPSRSGLSIASMKTFTKVFISKTFQQLPVAYENIWLAHGAIADLDEKQIRQLQQLPWVQRIHTLGRRVHLAKFRDSTSTYRTYGLEKIRLPSFQQAHPKIDGSGVRVGIIDTGIEASHPAFGGKNILFRDFTSNRTDPYDDHGHGSHVAGTIAGHPLRGQEIGVAPGADLVIAKAFDQRGDSVDQKLLEALQWIAENNVQILSASWTFEPDLSSLDPSKEPFCIAVEMLDRLGILPVFAAGNEGSAEATIGIPAACPKAIAVAATDESDQVADFSSRGPARWKNQVGSKPDIAAPGVDIESAGLGGGFAVKSGTSMATPHVAGSLALLMQNRTRHEAPRAREAILNGAKDLGAKGFDTDSGWGRIDLVDAFQNLTRQSDRRKPLAP